MNPKIVIRAETHDDVCAITEVTIAAFKTLEISNHTEQFIIEALRAAQTLTVSLVAEMDGRVVGHIAFSPVTISDGTPNWYGLGPVSVLPEHQQKGIGKALIQAGLSRLQEMAAQGCCLVGHPDYYRKLGFKNISGLMLEGVPQEVFFALSFDGHIPQGTVSFHEGFKADGPQKDFCEPSILRSIRKQQERVRDFVDPPYLRSFREQQERLQDLIDPPYLRSFREQQERLQDLIDPPYLRSFREQHGRLQDLIDPPYLRSFREQHGRLQDLIDPPHLRSFREQQEHFRDLVDPPALRSIRDQQMHFRDLIALPEYGSHSLTSVTAFARSAEFFGHGASLIESALRLGHLEHHADIAAIAASGILKLITQISVPSLQVSGELLDAGVDLFESPVEEAPADLVAGLPSEVFRALDVDIALRVGGDNLAENERYELASRTSDELETALARFDPELVGILSGARQAIFSDNPDRTRHVSISLRELLGHALHRLAPDPAVAAWTQDPAHFYDGKPTRKARFEYLYGAVAAPPLRRLIAADIRAALELFDVLSAGSHVVSLGTSATALMLLMTRAEGILLFLLRLEAHRNRGV